MSVRQQEMSFIPAKLMARRVDFVAPCAAIAAVASPTIACQRILKWLASAHVSKIRVVMIQKPMCTD